MTRKSLPGMGDHSAIKVTYAVLVNVAPGYTHRFDFDVRDAVDGLSQGASGRGPRAVSEPR